MQNLQQIHPDRSLPKAFSSGAAIGALGGLIGLGGAEFRLPLLIGMFGFPALEAVIVNKAVSLVVVAAALPSRLPAVPFSALLAHWTIAANLLAGSLVGAWLAAGWAVRISPAALHRVIGVLLLGIAAVLLFGHGLHGGVALVAPGLMQFALGIIAGLGIGVVAALLGVAGGELLIPTIILLYGADVKLAGSLSLAVSLPTMITGFARYSRDQSFAVLGRNRAFLIAMIVGSIIGSAIGGLLLPYVPSQILLPGLAVILVISAIKTLGKSTKHG